MKFLIVGLGSMGQRRIRCLKALGLRDITGFDVNNDRRQYASQEYNITILNNLTELELNCIDAMIISTPPDNHTEFLKLAINLNIPSFVEASVILSEVKEVIKLNKEVKNLIAPSCSMRFHPLIKDISEIIDSHQYGNVTNFSFHSGQYLPDWHPWEDIKNFYVSNRKTGGCREIVAFELTWLTELFGFPLKIKGYYGQTFDLGINIEDTYAFILKFNNSLGSVIVDVVSRYATRNLIVNLENSQILWNWDENVVKLFDAINKRWIYLNQPSENSQTGYNKNIIERMYIDETDAFLKAIQGSKPFPNTLERDLRILELLKSIEISDGGFIDEL